MRFFKYRSASGIFSFMLFFVFLSLFLSGAFSRAEEAKKTVIFGFAFNPMVSQTSFGNKGSADLRGMFQELAADEEKKYGYVVQLKIYSAPKFLFTALEKGEASFAPLTTSLYLMAKNRNLPVKPLFAVTSTGEKRDKICLYVRKASSIKKVKDLQGKTFAAEHPLYMSKKDAEPPEESYIYWTITKKILAKNGINKPFQSFFKEFKVLPVPSESVAYSVALNKFDAILLNVRDYRVMENYDPAFKEIAALDCLELSANAPLVYRTGTNPDIINTTKEFFLRKKDPKLKKIIKEEFHGVQIVEVQESDYAPYFKWLKEAEQKGWLKEFNEIMKTVSKQGTK